MTPEQQKVHFRNPLQSDPSDTASQTSAGVSETSWTKVKIEKKEVKKGVLKKTVPKHLNKCVYCGDPHPDHIGRDCGQNPANFTTWIAPEQEQMSDNFEIVDLEKMDKQEQLVIERQKAKRKRDQESNKNYSEAQRTESIWAQATTIVKADQKKTPEELAYSEKLGQTPTDVEDVTKTWRTSDGLENQIDHDRRLAEQLLQKRFDEVFPSKKLVEHLPSGDQGITGDGMTKLAIASGSQEAFTETDSLTETRRFKLDPKNNVTAPRCFEHVRPVRLLG